MSKPNQNQNENQEPTFDWARFGAAVKKLVNNNQGKGKVLTDDRDRIARIMGINPRKLEALFQGQPMNADVPEMLMRALGCDSMEALYHKIDGMMPMPPRHDVAKALKTILPPLGKRHQDIEEYDKIAMQMGVSTGDLKKFVSTGYNPYITDEQLQKLPAILRYENLEVMVKACSSPSPAPGSQAVGRQGRQFRGPVSSGNGLSM